jgi:hypothetical protein
LVKALSSKEIVGTTKTHDSLVCNRCSLPQHSPCPPLAPCHSSLPTARDENGAKMGGTFEWVDSGFQLNQIEVVASPWFFSKKKIWCMIGPRRLVIHSLKDKGKSMGLHWSSECASGAVQPRKATTRPFN